MCIWYEQAAPSCPSHWRSSRENLASVLADSQLVASGHIPLTYVPPVLCIIPLHI